MLINDAITLTNKIYIHEDDQSYPYMPEGWRVVGDDGIGGRVSYCLTVIWYYSDGKWGKWLWNVLFGPFKLWQSISPGGENHLVIQYTGTIMNSAEFADNITKRLVTRELLDKHDYTLIYTVWGPELFLKILASYTFGTVGKFIRKIRGQ